MTYNVFGGTLNVAQSIKSRPNVAKNHNFPAKACFPDTLTVENDLVVN